MMVARAPREDGDIPWVEYIRCCPCDVMYVCLLSSTGERILMQMSSQNDSKVQEWGSQAVVLRPGSIKLSERSSDILFYRVEWLGKPAAVCKSEKSLGTL